MSERDDVDAVVRPATFPKAGDGPRLASWLDGRAAKVQHLEFGAVEAGGRPRLRTLPPPSAAAVAAGAGHEPPSRAPTAAARPPTVPPAPPDDEVVVAERDSRPSEVLRELAGAEEAVVELSLAVAEALLGEALERDPTLHATLARRALESLGARADGVRLRASREAYAAIADAFGEPAIPWERARVPVVLDPSLEGLGCVAETEDAKADGRLPTLLAAVRRAFAEERRRAHEARDEGGAS